METILKIEFPDLTVDYIFPEEIRQAEFISAIQYIKKEELIQDSFNLLGGRYSRSSIIYPIFFQEPMKVLNFKVDLLAGNIYVGNIEAPTREKNILLAKMYNMRFVDGWE